MSKSLKMQDYSVYCFDKKEKVCYLLQGIFVVAAIGYFFYQSWVAFLLLMPILFLFLKEKKKELAKKQRQELGGQFKDMVLSVAANQKAGYSVENAFREAYKDMEQLYGAESMICREILQIVRGLENNVALEKLLYNLGVRSHQTDIMQFADVFMIAKRSGGNMTDILQGTAATIEQKIETDKEIQLMISARKMEQKIMNLVPFLIIFYIGTASKGFFDVLYHNLAGVVIMTGCLALYGAAVFLSRRMVEIEV